MSNNPLTLEAFPLILHGEQEQCTSSSPLIIMPATKRSWAQVVSSAICNDKKTDSPRPVLESAQPVADLFTRMTATTIEADDDHRGATRCAVVSPRPHEAVTMSMSSPQRFRYLELGTSKRKQKIARQQARKEAAHRAEDTQQSSVQTLMTFTKFPELPIELRCQLWSWAALVPRFIEFIKTNGSHRSCHVARCSRAPPAILHANSESRTEALRFYKLHTFKHLSGPTERKTLYYNPSADIIFPRCSSCIRHIGYFRLSAPARVAVVLEPRSSIIYSLLGPDQWTIARRFNFSWPGTIAAGPFALSGLKEVFIVVPSRVWAVKPGKIDRTVGYRQTSSHGLTKSVRNYYSRVQFHISRIIAGESPDWEMGEAPIFRFIGFAPNKPGSDVYDGLAITSKIYQTNNQPWRYPK